MKEQAITRMLDTAIARSDALDERFVGEIQINENSRVIYPLELDVSKLHDGYLTKVQVFKIGTIMPEGERLWVEVIYEGK